MSKVPPPPSMQRPPGFREPTAPIQRLPPAKPAANHLPSSYRPKRRRRSCCRAFCCCCCIVTTIILLLLLAVGAFFYLWFEPRFPEIHPKSISFSKLNVSITPEGPTFNSQSNIIVELKNPNRHLKVEYDRTQVSVNAADMDASLGELSQSGFTQDRKNVTTLKLVARAQNVVLDGDSAKKLSDALKNKNLAVNVEVSTGIGLKGSGLSTGMVPVEVFCEGMKLGQVLGDGGAEPKCRIKILNWIYIN